ncbi:hypothetical protein ACFYY2_05865 [Streptomyces sp. NPDC001822]|uniref:hypothetical protein n=1 Tax=Streptomyces sp. NPDC001822 TaxID=3364614 RepID=UPI0036C73B60
MSTSTPSDGRPERPDGPPAVSDEQWAQLVEQAGAGAADAPKEPSARARMVTARLRALDEDAARARGGARTWGRKPAQPEPWQPEGWRTGPAWQQLNGRPRKRRRIAGTLGFVAVLGVLVIAMRPSLVTDHLPGGNPTVDTLPLPAETAPPTDAPPGGPGPGLRPTLAEPFRGSPALRWAEGADGIEIPEAKAAGGMSEEQVGEALRATRRLLVASNLDPATLRAEKPSEALKLLEPKQDNGREKLVRSLAEPGEEDDPLLMFTRFAPDEARQAGNVVKVRGHMTFEGGRPGSVEVHADYTFVYPVVKPGGDEVARTIVRRRLTTVLYDPARYRVTPGKLALLRFDSRFGNTACEVYDGLLHPRFDSDPSARHTAGELVDPYERRTWPDQEEGCPTLSRT